MTAFRFRNRPFGSTGCMWEVHFALTAFNTREGAERLAAGWIKQRRLGCEWQCDECLPTDIDYPGVWEKFQEKIQN